MIFHRAQTALFFRFQTLKRRIEIFLEGKMGLSDRDYYNEDTYSSRRRSKSMSAVALLIIANVILYLLDQVSGGVLFGRMSLLGTAADNPLQWYRCLTYGFAHDPQGFWHILCNMLMLFFFGPVLERLYGKTEFLFFYLGSIVFGGVVWNVLHFGDSAGALGASGGISAIVILFACRFPKTVIYLYGIIPFPAWLAGVLYVVYDAFGAHIGTDNIGHDVHLAGAAFAAFYYFSGLRLSALFGGKKTKKNGGTFDEDKSGFSENDTKKSSFFGVFRTESKSKSSDRESLEKEVDRILEKYTKYGKESLTKEEEATLYRASKEFQKWRK